MTPLQKARRAFQIALKKAVQDVYSPDAPKQFYQLDFDGKAKDNIILITNTNNNLLGCIFR